MTTTIIVALVCMALFILFCVILDSLFGRLQKIEATVTGKKVEDLVGKPPTGPGKPAAAEGVIADLGKLEEVVASQGHLLYRLHVVLQQARMMPYEPKYTPLALLKGPPAELPQNKGPVTNYDVVALRHGQIIGYLAQDGTWTIDPKRIKIWTKEAEAAALCSKVVLSEGVTTKIRGHQDP